MQLSTAGKSEPLSYFLLDKPVGRKCLAALIGVGQARLQRSRAGTPDLRFGKREHRSQPGTWTADAFFQVVYDSIAETLPDKHLISIVKEFMIPKASFESKAPTTLTFFVIYSYSRVLSVLSPSYLNTLGSSAEGEPQDEKLIWMLVKHQILKRLDQGLTLKTKES